MSRIPKMELPNEPKFFDTPPMFYPDQGETVLERMIAHMNSIDQELELLRTNKKEQNQIVSKIDEVIEKECEILKSADKNMCLDDIGTMTCALARLIEARAKI